MPSMDHRSCKDDDFSSMEGAESLLVEEALKYLHNLNATIEDPSEVRQYLYHNIDLIELLRYVFDMTRRHFDFDTQMHLKMYCDREIQHERLTLYVRRHEYDKSIMKTIKDIRKDYRSQFTDIRGRFLLTTDFRIVE